MILIIEVITLQFDDLIIDFDKIIIKDEFHICFVDCLGKLYYFK